MLADLLEAAPGGDQLLVLGHVDAVEAGRDDRRRRDAQVHLERARLAQHLHDLARGGAAHDRVVHDDQPLARDGVRQRVELEAHAVLAQRLVGLDERAPDVAVLDQAVAEREARRACVALRRGSARVGHGDHDVGVGRRLDREALAHALALGVQRLAVHLGVRASEVDVLEHAHRLAAARRHGLLDAEALRVADQQLARLQLAHDLGADDVERRRLGGHHGRAVEIAQHERPDAVGIAEGEQRVLAQNDRRERAGDALHRVHGALGERARMVAR